MVLRDAAVVTGNLAKILVGLVGMAFNVIMLFQVINQHIRNSYKLHILQSTYITYTTITTYYIYYKIITLANAQAYRYIPYRHVVAV